MPTVEAPPKTSRPLSVVLSRLAAGGCALSAVLLAYGAAIFSGEALRGGNAAAFIPAFFFLGVAAIQLTGCLRLYRGKRYGAVIALVAAPLAPLGAMGLDPYVLTLVPLDALRLINIAIVLLLGANVVYVLIRGLRPGA